MSVSTAISGLQGAWDFAFAPDGTTLFITEKCVGLSVKQAGGQLTRLFTANSGAPDFFCEGQSGMNGVAVDPDFANNRFVYVYMASSVTHTNHVIRLTVAADFKSVSNRTDIITDIAYKQFQTAQGGPGQHSGGRLRFGPDGYLYVTTGDNHNPSLPQDLTRLGGKVLRVDRDGNAAPGNNTPSGGDARIYAYGFRNVQGISFRPGTNQPFISEHGPGHTDEVTPLVPGGNGGWDPQNRPFPCPDNYCGYEGDATSMPMTDTGRFPNAMRPGWANNGLSQGMGPSVFLRGTKWKSWENRLVVGIMGGQRVVVLELDGNGTAISKVELTDEGFPSTRPRSVVLGPDGDLYVIDENFGNILRVTPG